MTPNADIKKLQRNYIPDSFAISDWGALKPFFEELVSRDILSKDALENWLKDVSEMQALISEDACWRQIRMTCDTENKELEEAFHFFCLEKCMHSL